MSDVKNTLRVYQNIYFLLCEGSFGGKYAEGLCEAQKHAAEMIVTLEKNDKATDAAPADQPKRKRKAKDAAE